MSECVFLFEDDGLLGPRKKAQLRFSSRFPKQLQQWGLRKWLTTFNAPAPAGRKKARGRSNATIAQPCVAFLDAHNVFEVDGEVNVEVATMTHALLRAGIPTAILSWCGEKSMLRHQVQLRNVLLPAAGGSSAVNWE